MTKETTLSANSAVPEDKQAPIIKSVFWRTMWLMFCTSYTKQQGTTFAWTMIPYLQDIYGKDTDEFYEAMERHENFFNTTPAMSPFIVSLVISMEYERKAALDAGKSFDDSSIESLKAALMGPLAGIGDSIMVGVLRVLATGIAIGFSQEGSWLGPILFAVTFNVPNLLIRWFLSYYGMKLGTGFVSDALESGKLAAFTKGFTALGMIMVGAMVGKYVTVSTSLVIETGAATFDLQSVLNGIMPGLVPLTVTLLCFRYLKKGGNVMKLLVIMIVLCFVFTLLGITG